MDTRRINVHEIKRVKARIAAGLITIAIILIFGVLGFAKIDVTRDNRLD